MSLSQKNGMNIGIGEFMLKRSLFVCRDLQGYAYKEYMLMSGMLITRVNYMNPCYRLYRVGDVRASADRVGVPLDHIPTRANNHVLFPNLAEDHPAISTQGDIEGLILLDEINVREVIGVTAR